MNIERFVGAVLVLLTEHGPMTADEIYRRLGELTLSEAQVQSLLDGGVSAGRWQRNGTAYLRDDGEPDETLEARARELLSKGRPAAAAAVWEVLVAREPSDFRRLLEWATALTMAGNPRVSEVPPMLAAAQQRQEYLPQLQTHPAYNSPAPSPGAFAVARSTTLEVNG